MSTLKMTWCFLFTITLLGQSAREVNPRAPSQTRTSTQALILRESKRYLDLYHYAETAKQSFLATVNKKPWAQKYQECIACMAAQFTSESYAPQFSKVVLEFMTLQQLMELNDFLESPLGIKFIALSYATVDNKPAPIFTAAETQALNAEVKKPYFLAYGKFTQNGLPRLSTGPEANELNSMFKENCKHLPHPWRD